MKLDKYTKIVLTVIACALVALVFQNTLEIKAANAAGKLTKVVICDPSGSPCANICVQGGGVEGIQRLCATR